MHRGELRPPVGAVRRPIAAEDSAEGQHGMPAVRWSRAALASTSALCVRWVEIAVVVGEACPSQTWIRRRLTPDSSRWAPPGMAPGMHGGGVQHAGYLDGALKGAKVKPGRRGLGQARTVVGGWKEPDRVAVGSPMAAQQRQRAWGQRDVAILIAFAALNVQLHACTIDLGHPKGDAFAEAQATGGDDAQADLIVREVDLSEDLPDLIGTEHDGERVRLGWANQLQQRPRALESALEEERDRTEGHSTAGAGGLFVVAEGEKVLAEVLVTEQIGRLAVVEGQLANFAEVGVLGSWGKPAQLHVLKPALS
jgi:hypothetical protein